MCSRFVIVRQAAVLLSSDDWKPHQARYRRETPRRRAVQARFPPYSMSWRETWPGCRILTGGVNDDVAPSQTPPGVLALSTGRRCAGLVNPEAILTSHRHMMTLHLDGVAVTSLANARAAGS
jgi:hypothetical protein